MTESISAPTDSRASSMLDARTATAIQEDAWAVPADTSIECGPVRRKLPAERHSITHKFSIGWTGNPQIPYATSIMDYIFRWLGVKFLGPEYAVPGTGEPEL